MLSQKNKSVFNLEFNWKAIILIWVGSIMLKSNMLTRKMPTHFDVLTILTAKTNNVAGETSTKYIFDRAQKTS